MEAIQDKLETLVCTAQQLADNQAQETLEQSTNLEPINQEAHTMPETSTNLEHHSNQEEGQPINQEPSKAELSQELNQEAEPSQAKAVHHSTAQTIILTTRSHEI